LTEALEQSRPRKLADHYPAWPRDLGLWLMTFPPKDKFRRLAEALDALPPIRLRSGPAIPWRLGLPLFADCAVVRS